MTTLAVKAGCTFAYSGIVSGLDPAVAWGAAAELMLSSTRQLVPGVLSASIAKSPDFATTSNWVLSVYASAADTMRWLEAMSASAGRATSGPVCFDIKLFNTAGSDPVIRCDTIMVSVTPPVTP